MCRALITQKLARRSHSSVQMRVCNVELAFEVDSPSSLDVGSDEGLMTLINGIVEAQTGEQKEILFNNAVSLTFFLSAEQLKSCLMMLQRRG